MPKITGYLSPKQYLFAQEYAKTGNATQSAIKAGYSEKTATVMGYENLQKPQIQEAIQQFKRNLQEEFKAYSGQALDTLLKIMNTSQSERIKMDCAKEILDRAGYSSVSTTLIKGTGENGQILVENKQIAELIDRTRTMINVTPERKSIDA